MTISDRQLKLPGTNGASLMSAGKYALQITLTGIFALLTVALTPITAQAQSSSWGGSSQWGGGRKAVPFAKKHSPGSIIVSFGDRRLYFITKRGQALSYPIAVPRADARWQGVTNVSMKKKNPAWRPTPTMLKKNPRLPRWVPGGHRMNPLGVRALYLGSSTYRIHGTDAPWTIGTAASSGCIRMHNKDVLDLYPRTRVGARVTVTWKRYSGARAYTSSNSY